MPQAMTDIRGAIRAANDRFEALFGTKDTKGIAGLYTNDALLMPPGGEATAGANGIREFWQNVLNMGLTGARLESVEVESFGDTAIEVGRYTLFAGDSVADRGKYIVEWKADRDGNWRLHRDIWNSSVAR